MLNTVLDYMMKIFFLKDTGIYIYQYLDALLAKMLINALSSERTLNPSLGGFNDRKMFEI